MEPKREYSIARFPHEVLALIFEADLDWSFPVASDIAISHVSRHWRNAAIHTASLWCVINILPFQPIEKTTTYLERSRGYPLTVTVDTKTSLYKDSTVFDRFEAVANHVHRWRAFDIYSSSYDFLCAALNRLHNTSAPLLGAIFISFEDDNLDDEDDDDSHVIDPENLLPLSIFTGGCPRLESLGILGLDIRIFWPPAAQIVDLYLKFIVNGPYITLEGFRSIIQLMPNLKSLSLAGNLIDIPLTLPPVDHTIIIPLLESLELTQIDDLEGNQDLRLFLTSTWMPMLQTLMLNDMEQDLSQLVHGVRDSSRKPLFPVLRHISLHHISNGNWTADASFFSSMPSICSFNLYHDDIHTPTILKSLRTTPTQPADMVFWPKLNVICLEIYHQHSFDALCDLITYRQSVRKPITFINISDYRTISGIDFEECRKWLQHNVPTVHIWQRKQSKGLVYLALYLLFRVAHHHGLSRIPV